MGWVIKMRGMTCSLMLAIAHGSVVRASQERLDSDVRVEFQTG